MSDLLVIAHGKLQCGSAARRWARAEKRLKEIFGDKVEIRFTAGQGDATGMTREALKSGANWLAAAGGDGTFHEAANGFFVAGRNIRPSAALSFIPSGSGNDWARTLGIPLNSLSAVEILEKSRVRRVDAGLVTYRETEGARGERVFLNVAEAGAGGRLVASINRGRFYERTRLGYRLGSIAAALSYVRRNLRISFDGEPAMSTGPALSLIVAGGQYFGAGMKCAPTARPDDGKLEVIVIGDFGRVELLCRIHRFFSGTHLSHPKVLHRSAQTIAADSVGEVLLELDGELVGSLPATFTVLPGALAVRF